MRPMTETVAAGAAGRAVPVSAALAGDGTVVRVLASEAPFRASARGEQLFQANWPQLIRNTRLKLEPLPDDGYDVVAAFQEASWPSMVALLGCYTALGTPALLLLAPTTTCGAQDFGGYRLGVAKHVVEEGFS